MNVADDGMPKAVKDLGKGPGRAVLIIDPRPDQQARLARLMAVHGHRAIGTSSLDGAFAFLQAFPADLVLLAEEAAGTTPQSVVDDIADRRPNARVAIMVPDIDDDAGLDGMERSATLKYVPLALSGETLATLLPS